MIAVRVRRWAVAFVLVTAAPFTFAQAFEVPRTEGLKALPDARQFFDVQVDENWSLMSWLKFPSLASTEGLKLDVGGGYGWNIGRANRLSVAAGVGLADDAQARPILDGQGRQLPFASGTSQLAARDVAFNLLWNWRYSESIALTSGLGLRYALTDALQTPVSSAQRPASAAGYVGLQLRF